MFYYKCINLTIRQLAPRKRVHGHLRGDRHSNLRNAGIELPDVFARNVVGVSKDELLTFFGVLYVCEFLVLKEIYSELLGCMYSSGRVAPSPVQSGRPITAALSTNSLNQETIFSSNSIQLGNFKFSFPHFCCSCLLRPCHITIMFFFVMWQ